MMNEDATPLTAQTILTKAAISLTTAAEALTQAGQAQQRSHKPATPKRGLTRNEAAHYIGVSPTTFDRLVHQRVMPKPIKAFSRMIWDLKALDDAFEVHALVDEQNPWN